MRFANLQNIRVATLSSRAIRFCLEKTSSSKVGVGVGAVEEVCVLGHATHNESTHLLPYEMSGDTLFLFPPRMSESEFKEF